MIKGIEGVKPIVAPNKADRTDSWYKGKMTQRTVPSTSRRPAHRTLTAGSHLVSDIGEVPIPDHQGNRYFVVFKCMCTQFRKVYRMRTKDALVQVWKQFIADYGMQEKEGKMVCRIRYLVTDDDVMYVKGKVAEANKEHLIGKYTLAPYTHQANPSENEMRRLMEGAVQLLHSSGLPPSFLLDALDCHVESKNRLFTPICHDPTHQFQTPHQRMLGTKPDINDIARFGCKTYVYVTKPDRAKHDSHCWIGFYVGPSQNMSACRVYRPLKHSIYDRYHTLHNCDIVYGDIMGKMYQSRVDTDQAQREYYNNEVDTLIGTTCQSDTIAAMVKQLPWAQQPMPDAHTHASDTRTREIGPQRAVTRQGNSQNTTPQVGNKRTRDQNPVRTVTKPRKTPAPTANPAATGLSPATTTLDPTGAQDHARRSLFTPAEANTLLRGVPTKVQLGLLDIMDSMAEYMREVEVLQDTDFTMLHLYAELENLPTASQTECQFIQLCEETSRRIVQSKEPTSFKQIQRLDGTIEGKLVREAMLDEVVWMVNHGKVIPRDRSTIQFLKEIDGQWVVKFKKTIDGLLDKVRARWVLRGDKQRPHVDYDPKTISSPVATKTATLAALTLAVQYALLLCSVDVSKAFTVSSIDQPGLFMEVPKGVDYSNPDLCPFGSDTTWELLTTLYGLKQASAMYYNTFTNIVMKYTDAKGQKYRRNRHDPCSFTKGTLGTNDFITFSIHIDDKFVACSTKEHVHELLGVLKKANFTCTVEPMTLALGMKIDYTLYNPGIPGSGKLLLDHSNYITDCFTEAKQHFDKSKHSPLSVPMTIEVSKAQRPADTEVLVGTQYKLFRSILGKVSHCANFTHPEISIAVSIVSTYMSAPSPVDLIDTFNILRYLMSTVNKPSATFTLQHNPLFDSTTSTHQNPIHLLCDADLSNCRLTRRSRTGFCGYLFGNLCGWNARKQKSVSLSTAESEYVALSACAQFGKWFKGLMSDMGLELSHCKPVVILCDSKSAITIAESPAHIMNKYSKHIERRVHWFREQIRDGTLRVQHVPGTDNIADLFTKCLGAVAFKKYRDSLLRGDFRVLDEGGSYMCIVDNSTIPFKWMNDM